MQDVIAIAVCMGLAILFRKVTLQEQACKMLSQYWIKRLSIRLRKVTLQQEVVIVVDYTGCHHVSAR